VAGLDNADKAFIALTDLQPQFQPSMAPDRTVVVKPVKGEVDPRPGLPRSRRHGYSPHPVRAGLVEQPADFVFSGHRELMGKIRIEDDDFAADLESLDQALSTKVIERLEELRTADQES
jgi:hypothetical protein